MTINITEPPLEHGHSVSRRHYWTISHTEISIPVVFENKYTVTSGENEKFNEAVRRCDTNKDGLITEAEAEIFASQFH